AWIALPKAAMVKGDDFEPLGESRNLILPEGSKAPEPGDEQDGEAHAVPLVIERAVTDRNQGHRFAAQDGCGSVPSARAGCQRAGQAQGAEVDGVVPPDSREPA